MVIWIGTKFGQVGESGLIRDREVPIGKSQLGYNDKVLKSIHSFFFVEFFF